MVLGVCSPPSFPRRLGAECALHARKEMESLQGQTPDCNAFLQLVDQKWQDHCSSMLTLRNIFLYLDRSFVLQTPSLRSIWDMGLELFRTHLQVRLCAGGRATTEPGSRGFWGWYVAGYGRAETALLEGL